MNPQYLYHYTNIEALASILKNKTIRFSPLDKMDDLQETESSDVHNIGQIIYVSSWTNDKEESIPMWNIYASLSSGVRIKLPAMPFKLHENHAEDLAKAVQMPVKDESNGKPLVTLIPITEMVQKKIVSIEALNKNILFKVEYTSDQEKLLPHVKTTDGSQFTLALGDLGKYKNIKWAFQHEWRYRM